MRFVGLIPARGGSKGIPGKNIVPCAGKPLIQWTCDAARGSRRLSRTIVSTDSAEIAAVARGCGAEVPFLRPAELARDETPALPVIQHALRWFDAQGQAPDAIVLLQPTSPLRASAHIDEAIGLFEARSADTVVSVVRVPHRFHPSSVMWERNGALVPYEGEETVTRRQEQPPLFARNGPAVLVVSRATLQSGRLYGGCTLGYLMDDAASVDIDTPADLRMAEWLLSR